MSGLQVISDNTVIAVTASSEDSSYPAENVMDNHPKKVWVANGDLTASLSCEVAGPADTLAVFGTNAVSAVVNISDPNEINWPDCDWVEVTWVYSNIHAEIELQQVGGASALWATFAHMDVPLSMDIVLTADDVVEAGVVVVGEAAVFANPARGMSEGLKDYSTILELSNGAIYHKQRDVVRTFEGQILTVRDDEFYVFMHDVARANSYQPMAWRLTDISGFEWVVYAMFSQPPMGNHQYFERSLINFSLTEVL